MNEKRIKQIVNIEMNDAMRELYLMLNNDRENYDKFHPVAQTYAMNLILGKITESYFWDRFCKAASLIKATSVARLIRWRKTMDEGDDHYKVEKQERNDVCAKWFLQEVLEAKKWFEKCPKAFYEFRYGKEIASLMEKFDVEEEIVDYYISVEQGWNDNVSYEENIEKFKKYLEFVTDEK